MADDLNNQDADAEGQLDPAFTDSGVNEPAQSSDPADDALFADFKNSIYLDLDLDKRLYALGFEELCDGGFSKWIKDKYAGRVHFQVFTYPKHSTIHVSYFTGGSGGVILRSIDLMDAEVSPSETYDRVEEVNSILLSPEINTASELRAAFANIRWEHRWVPSKEKVFDRFKESVDSEGDSEVDPADEPESMLYDYFQHGSALADMRDAFTSHFGVRLYRQSGLAETPSLVFLWCKNVVTDVTYYIYVKMNEDRSWTVTAEGTKRFYNRHDEEFWEDFDIEDEWTIGASSDLAVSVDDILASISDDHGPADPTESFDPDDDDDDDRYGLDNQDESAATDSRALFSRLGIVNENAPEEEPYDVDTDPEEIARMVYSSPRTSQLLNAGLVELGYEYLLDEYCPDEVLAWLDTDRAVLKKDWTFNEPFIYQSQFRRESWHTLRCYAYINEYGPETPKLIGRVAFACAILGEPCNLNGTPSWSPRIEPLVYRVVAVNMPKSPAPDTGVYASYRNAARLTEIACYCADEIEAMVAAVPYGQSILALTPFMKESIASIRSKVEIKAKSMSESLAQDSAGGTDSRALFSRLGIVNEDDPEPYDVDTDPDEIARLIDTLEDRLVDPFLRRGYTLDDASLSPTDPSAKCFFLTLNRRLLHPVAWYYDDEAEYTYLQVRISVEEFGKDTWMSTPKIAGKITFWLSIVNDPTGRDDRGRSKFGTYIVYVHRPLDSVDRFKRGVATEDDRLTSVRGICKIASYCAVEIETTLDGLPDTQSADHLADYIQSDMRTVADRAINAASAENIHVVESVDVESEDSAQFLIKAGWSPESTEGYYRIEFQLADSVTFGGKVYDGFRVRLNVTKPDAAIIEVSVVGAGVKPVVATVCKLNVNSSKWPDQSLTSFVQGLQGTLEEVTFSKSGGLLLAISKVKTSMNKFMKMLNTMPLAQSKQHVHEDEDEDEKHDIDFDPESLFDQLDSIESVVADNGLGCVYKRRNKTQWRRTVTSGRDPVQVRVYRGVTCSGLLDVALRVGIPDPDGGPGLDVIWGTSDIFQSEPDAAYALKRALLGAIKTIKDVGVHKDRYELRTRLQLDAGDFLRRPEFFKPAQDNNPPLFI